MHGEKKRMQQKKTRTNSILNYALSAFFSFECECVALEVPQK